MRGELYVSDVLGVDGTSREPLGVSELRILDVAGAGSDSDTPRRLLTVPPMLGHSERVTADSTRSESRSEMGVPIPALGHALAESVRALVRSTRTGSRTERGGLVLTIGMVQEWLATMGDGARRGGRARNEWRVVCEPPKLRIRGIEGVSADKLGASL